jgi:hypothetical protein
MLVFSIFGVIVCLTFPSEECWDLEEKYFHLNEEGVIS